MSIAQIKHVLMIVITLFVASWAIAQNSAAKPPSIYHWGKRDRLYFEVDPACIEKALDTKGWRTTCPINAGSETKVVQRFRKNNTWGLEDTPAILEQTVTDGENTTHYHLRIPTILGDSDSALVPFEMTINTGGSGLFSRLVIAQVNRKKQTVDVLAQLGKGDRCNDGYARFERWVWNENGNFQGLEFSTSATPFRLLNVEDTTDWRGLLTARLMGEKIEIPETYRDWRPYVDVENGAQSCVGRVKKMANLVEQETSIVDVSLDKEALNALETKGQLNQCVRDALLSAAQPNEAESHALKHWLKAVSVTTRGCTDQVITSKAATHIYHTGTNGASVKG
jgi:hypothetical protein